MLFDTPEEYANYNPLPEAGLRGGKDSALVVKYTLYFIPDHQVTFRDLPQRVEDTVFVFDVFV